MSGTGSGRGASVVVVGAVWRIGQGPAPDATGRLLELLASQLPGQPAAEDSSGVSLVLLHSHSFLVRKGPRGPRSHQNRCRERNQARRAGPRIGATLFETGEVPPKSCRGRERGFGKRGSSALQSFQPSRRQIDLAGTSQSQPGARRAPEQGGPSCAPRPGPCASSSFCSLPSRSAAPAPPPAGRTT